MAKKLEQEYQVDKKVREYRLKNILKYVWLLLSLATIVLEILALCNVIHFGWGVLTFVLASLAKIYVQSNSPKEEQNNNKKIAKKR